MHCVHGQAPWPVSLGPLRPGRRALSKLCPPSRGTDPSAPAGRPDKAEDPDALQSLADLETTAGRIWNLTMDVAAAATAGDESSEKGQREGDDDASFALQQRLEDLSMLQTSQMQQLMVVRISHSLSLSWQKVVKFARLRQCMFSSCICMKKKKNKAGNQANQARCSGSCAGKSQQRHHRRSKEFQYTMAPTRAKGIGRADIDRGGIRCHRRGAQGPRKRRL